MLPKDILLLIGDVKNLSLRLIAGYLGVHMGDPSGKLSQSAIFEQFGEFLLAACPKEQEDLAPDASLLGV